MKLLRVCDLRKHLDAYRREEITFSRMVELLNEDATKAFIETIKLTDEEKFDLIDRKYHALSTETIKQLVKYDFTFCEMPFLIDMAIAEIAKK